MPRGSYLYDFVVVEDIDMEYVDVAVSDLYPLIYGVDMEMEKLSPMERTKIMAKFEKYMQRSSWFD